ncbi:TPA_asm: hypothetical protein vir524_00056 [Caudoviricetes sp. vir524]|nr:TPA_asm: hypothetical protein vir524_00056 [Caudoviricetes sp. vir524]
MKIDIHITDATPEEAALVFTGVTVGQAVGRVAASVAEKHVRKGIARATPAQKQVPDPLPGHTGCEDCDHDLRDVAGCERCSPPPTPEPAKRPKATVKGKPGPAPGSGKGNSFGIPALLYTTDKNQYQRLWARCKTKGIKYEQALAMEGKTKLVGRHAKKMGRPPLATTPPKVVEKSSEPLFDEVIKKTANPPHEPITREGEPARCKDGSLPASAARGKIRELVAVKNGELRAGQRIKHNGPKASPFFGKEGKIVKVSPNSGEVFVDFGASSTWLAPHIVMVVPEVPA